MPRITRELLRKRAEHNEGMISTLEEISLHQEELEAIEVVGDMCPRLKILYLQNNLIPEITGLKRCRDLGYLNVALNCITTITGLDHLEALYKLDLTVNFIDVDELQNSMEHLQRCDQLKELFMIGNPCQAAWPGFQNYVIGMLPQLESLDGTEITRSMRIVAGQQLPALQAELARLAADKRGERAAEAARKAAEGDVIEVGAAGEVIEVSGGESVVVGDADDDDEEAVSESKTGGDEEEEYTPAARRAMYLELAEQKAEKERRSKENQPRERDYAAEHAAAVERERELERERGNARQRNEGGWDFRVWEDDGCVKFEVELPRFLDSSLIDVDVQPTTVSLVIKGKVLRLNLPAEVRPDAGSAQRSKTTGALLITMPVLDAKKNVVSVRASRRAEAEARAAREAEAEAEEEKKAAGGAARRPQKLADQLLAAVDVANIVRHEGDEPAKPLMTAVSTTRDGVEEALPPPPGSSSGSGSGKENFEDNPEVPPLE